MTHSILDLSSGDLPAKIQSNLTAYMSLFADLPGVFMHDEDSFWFVSGNRAPGNLILRAHWPEDQAEAQIDALFEQIGQHIDHIDWMVFPGDQPDDLGQRLKARGMPGGRGGNWLWTDLTALAAAPAVPDNFRIEQVLDDRSMAVWLKATEAGFGANEAIFYDAYARHGYGADAFSLHYIGYLGDVAVTSGTLLDACGSAAIYDLSTPPAFRGQGFGGALTYALMSEISKRGYAETWIWASDQAKSLYRTLGYVDADFGLREHTWHKR